MNRADFFKIYWSRTRCTNIRNGSRREGYDTIAYLEAKKNHLEKKLAMDHLFLKKAPREILEVGDTKKIINFLLYPCRRRRTSRRSF
jgi:hypothetical protein